MLGLLALTLQVKVITAFFETSNSDRQKLTARDPSVEAIGLCQVRYFKICAVPEVTFKLILAASVATVEPDLLIPNKRTTPSIVEVHCSVLVELSFTFAACVYREVIF